MDHEKERNSRDSPSWLLQRDNGLITKNPESDQICYECKQEYWGAVSRRSEQNEQSSYHGCKKHREGSLQRDYRPSDSNHVLVEQPINNVSTIFLLCPALFDKLVQVIIGKWWRTQASLLLHLVHSERFSLSVQKSIDAQCFPGKRRLSWFGWASSTGQFILPLLLNRFLGSLIPSKWKFY